MPVSSWSTNQNANTTVGGIFIGEGCPPSNLNDAAREIMAEAKDKFDALDEEIEGISGKPALALIAPLVPAADKVALYTGPDAASLMTVTAFARSLLDDVGADQARATLSAVGTGGYSGGASGYATFLFGSVPFIVQWGTTFGPFSEGQAAIGFPEAFPATCYVVLPIPVVASAQPSNDYGCQLIGSPDSNGFSFMVQKFGSSGTGLSGISWIALGM